MILDSRMRSQLWHRASRRGSRPALWIAGVGLCLGLVMVVFPALAVDLQGHRGARGLAPENTLTRIQALHSALA